MIGIIFIAIGRYVDFFPDFYVGAEAFFFPGRTKRYFLITDNPEVVLPKIETNNVEIVKVPPCKWPWPTLNRFTYALQLNSLGRFLGISNLFFFNANCRFVCRIDDDRLLTSPIVATLHPGYYNKPRSTFTYESRTNSRAFVAPHEGKYYLAGGFQGGKLDIFLNCYQACISMVEADLANKIIAIWHDESYWNRMLIDFVQKSSCEVYFAGPEYLFPIGERLSVVPKIILLDKRFIPSGEGGSLQELKSQKLIAKLIPKTGA